MESSAPTPVADLGRRAKAASRVLATTSTAAKDEALTAAADLLEQRSGDVLAANAVDVDAAAAGGMEPGPLDRLRLTDGRLASMAAGLRKVAALPDPAVTALLREGAAKAGLPEDSILLVDDVSHEAAVELMQLTGLVDCLIPRGGPSLVRSILDNAKVPYVIDGDGNCHVYVDAAA